MKYLNKPFMTYTVVLYMYSNAMEVYPDKHAYCEKLRLLLKESVILNGTGKVAEEINQMVNLKSYDSIEDLIRRISDYQVYNEVYNFCYNIDVKRFIDVYLPKIEKAITLHKEINVIMDECEDSFIKGD